MACRMPYPDALSATMATWCPFSDYGGQGAPVHFKAWVCTNPDCSFTIKIRGGEVYFNERVKTYRDGRF